MLGHKAYMKVEIELTPVSAMHETLELAQMVDQFGAERLGISDVVLFRDVYTTMALCAERTHRVMIGPLVTNPYLRHPVSVAASFATLNEISNRRMFLGIGVGSGISQLGYVKSRPSEILEEFILMFKAVLKGDASAFRGNYFSAEKMTLPKDLIGEVPIIIGSRSERVCKMAGRLADGVVVGTREISQIALSKYVSWIHGAADEVGRSRNEVPISPRVTVCISEDRDVARKSVVLYTAHYSTLSGHDESIMEKWRYDSIKRLASLASGWYFQPDVTYPDDLNELVSPDLIDLFTISGTPSDCLKKLRSLRDMGFENVSMNIAAIRRPGSSIYHGTKETLIGLKSIMPNILAI